MPRSSVWRALAAGLLGGAAGSLAAALPLAAERALDLLPRFEPIGLLAGILQQLLRRYAGIVVGDGAGWAAHAVLGTVVWGGLYGLLVGRWPRAAGPLGGMAFALGPWAAMSLMLWPLYPSFGSGVPARIVAFALVFHLVYGAAAGWTVRRIGVR